MKKSRLKGKTRQKKSQKFSRLYVHAFLVSAVVFIGFAAYLGYLDQQIQAKFSGTPWSVPARVYGRPVEIYIGKPLGSETLQTILTGVGYQRGNPDQGPGHYNRAADTVTIHTRDYSFWDGHVAAQKITVVIASGKVSRITVQDTGRSLAYFRLEPRLIGKIYPLHNEDRILVPYDQVPQSLVDALIAVEDRRFFSHAGIDPRGIVRAFIANFRSGEFVQGGSTLTQQLVKNFFLSPERTIRRKLNEMVMAMLIEIRYSKAEILAAYINEVYLGQDGAKGIHGFGTAAEFYFRRPLQELTTAQLAMLAGLVKGASFYNPVRNPQRALQRRNLVLDEMHEIGFLDDRELAAAQTETLGVDTKNRISHNSTGAFLDLVKNRLLQAYQLEDLQNEGLRIFTTLDPLVQQQLQGSVQKRLQILERSSNKQTRDLQAAAIISSADTGEVLALTGSRRSAAGSFNRALHSRRPIGSLIKPFVYLAAISSSPGYHPHTYIDDREVEIELKQGKIWRPGNYSGESHGRVTLLEALARSYNLATVNLGMEIGLDQVAGLLRQIGLERPFNRYPSLLLGAIELTPLEVTQLYQVLASGGFRTPLTVISEVLTRNGKPLQRSQIHIQQVVKPRHVAVINSMLTTVVESGTARALKATFPGTVIAGKTGTTNDLRDSWFAGFGADYLGVVWVGKDDNTATGLTGASGAMQIWGDMMKSVSPGSLTSLSVEGTRRVRVRDFEGNCHNDHTIVFPDNAAPEPGLICE